MPKTAVDPWNATPGDSSFGQKGAQIAPDDDVDLAVVSKGLVILATGTLSFIPADNADSDHITFAALPAGYVVPYFVRRVLSTGTTATVASIDS